jgi:hypothetical protein
MSTSKLRKFLRGLLVGGLALVPLVAFSTPAQAASDASVGVVNGCGSLYVRPTLASAFQQHTGCASVLDTAISPDGRYIAVINSDKSLAIKDGLWGHWQSHVGPNDAKKVALGPKGMVGIVNGCGAAMIKTSIFGTWQQHTSCASVVDLAISPEGRYVAVINADGSLSIKDGLWGAWRTHLSAGDANDVALGPNGMVGVVNGCHSMYVKTSISGAWDQHLGCNGARSVAISADGQVIGAITGDGSSYAKRGLWGNWVLQTQAGDTKALFVGPTAANFGGQPSSPTGLIAGTDRDLAQKILSSGKVTGDSRYIGQIRAYANGTPSCHINPTILSLIYTVVASADAGGLNHTVYISSLNRLCTGVITGSGTTSYHYRESGGHAVDFATVDGVSATGTTAQDLTLLKQLVVRLPAGSGIGQANCRTKDNALVTPAGVTQFTDTCNHNHLQVPVK